MKSRGQTSNGWGCMFVAASSVSIASSVYYVRTHGIQSRMSFWLGLPLVALGAALGHDCGGRLATDARSIA